MDLLVFAHRNEAQAFLSHYPYQIKTDERNKALSFYQGPRHHILITGEGYHESLKKTLFQLSNHSYRQVLNLGVAGALYEKLELGSIYPIRTSYGQIGKTPMFSSYTSASQQAQLDCVTTHSRLTHDNDAKLLSIKADIVDRELWGIAQACHFMKIDFRSFKLISDYAQTVDCQNVASNAVAYSRALYSFYQDHIGQLESPLDDRQLPLSTLKLIDSLHPSFSQRVQLTKLVQKCLLQKLSYEELLKPEKYLDWPRKSRNQKIIQDLKYLLNPLEEEFHHQCDQLSSSHCKVAYQNENPLVKVQANIQSLQELHALQHELETFNFSQLEALYRGEF